MLCVDLEVSRLGQLFFGEPLARNIDIYASHIGIHFPLLFYLSEFESSVYFLSFSTRGALCLLRLSVVNRCSEKSAMYLTYHSVLNELLTEFHTTSMLFTLEFISTSYSTFQNLNLQCNSFHFQKGELYVY